MLNYRLDWHSLASYFEMEEVVATPGTPEANHIRLYATDNGSGTTQLCYKNDAGTVICLPVTGSLLTGTGTDNRLALWNGTTAIDDFNLTAGSLLFGGAGGIAAQDNSNLFWNNTSKSLGIGTASPNLTDVGTPLYDKTLTITATAVGALELASSAADAADVSIGWLSAVSLSNLNSHKRLAEIGFETEGTTATKRGGRILFRTKPDNAGSSTPLERFRVGSAGQWGIGGAIYGSAAQYFRSAGNAASPTWATIAASEIGGGAALSKTDDTNVTLTLGGSPTVALLTASSLTLGWTGQLAAGRGGTGVSALGDLTKTDDTNVTLALGGMPTGALITSTSLTLGWTGNLSVARGGSGAGTFTVHGVLLGEGTSAFVATGTGNSGQVLTSNGAFADPTFQDAAGGGSGLTQPQVLARISMRA